MATPCDDSAAAAFRRCSRAAVLRTSSASEAGKLLMMKHNEAENEPLVQSGAESFHCMGGVEIAHTDSTFRRRDFMDLFNLKTNVCDYIFSDLPPVTQMVPIK